MDLVEDPLPSDGSHLGGLCLFSIIQSFYSSRKIMLTHVLEISKFVAKLCL